MDLYAREGNSALIESAIGRLESTNIMHYCQLIKAYGVRGLPERGEWFLQKLLREDSDVDPNLTAFNILLNAWAINASLPDAPNRALAIIRFMDHDLKCIQLGLQPDVTSFNTVLKCLAQASASHEALVASPDVNSSGVNYGSQHDVGQFAENILNEMVERFRNGNRTVLPDTITYNSCILACANVGDERRVEAFLQRMKNAGVSPNLRTYNNVLLLYTHLRSVVATKKAEDLLMELKMKARTNPTLTPDVCSYNIVFKAMANSGDPTQNHQIWKTYKKMRDEDGVQPDIIMYTFLIVQLAKGNELVHLENATELLEDMEQNHVMNVLLRPDHRHYMPVIEGWIDKGKSMQNASMLFLRFVNNYARGRTGNDRPTQEAMHRLVRGWIDDGNLTEAMKFVDNLETFNERPVKKGYKTLPYGPSVECYRDLLSAWVTSSRKESGHAELRERYITELRKKLKVLLNVTED